MKPRKTPSRKDNFEPRVAGILGLGLDNTDGHKRITHTAEMVLLGGSQETHEQMQETAVKFSEGLAKRGKSLPEISAREAIELLHEVHERTRR